MVSYEVSIGFVIITVLLCAGSLNLTDDRRGAGHAAGGMFGWYWLPLFPMFVDLLHLGAGRDQPAAVRSGRSGIRTRRRLHGRIRLDALHAVHARRICRDRHHVRA